MKVQFELSIGENKFILSEDVDTHADFFKKLNFYSSLPKVGPNGETDLTLRFRKAKTKQGKDCEYYSIVSQKAKQEYKFGQSQGVVGGLFPKGWEPLFNSGAEENGEEEQEQTSIAPGTSVGLGVPASAAAAAPQQAPTAAKPASGFGVPSTTAAKAPAPATQTSAAPPVSNGAAQVANQAKNVLSKFGI